MERNRGSTNKATWAATLEVDPLAQASEASDDCSPCHILTTTTWERMSKNHSARLLLNSWPTKNFQRCVIHQQVTIYKLNYKIPIVNRCISYQCHHQFYLQVLFQDILGQDPALAEDLFDQCLHLPLLHLQNQQVLLEDVLNRHLLPHFR